MTNLPSFRPRGVLGVTGRGDQVMISPEFQRWLDIVTRQADAIAVSTSVAVVTLASYPVASSAPLFAAYPATGGDAPPADYPQPTQTEIFAEY